MISSCPQHPYPSPLCRVQEVEDLAHRGERIVGYVPGPIPQQQASRDGTLPSRAEVLVGLFIAAVGLIAFAAALTGGAA